LGVEPPQQPQEQFYFANLLIIEGVWAEMHDFIPNQPDIV